jgi:hypothetical protein
MKKQKYDVISPDGFSISVDKTWSSPETAQQALTEWIKRYEIQAYYSSNNGRIPLGELESYCKIIPLD